MKRIFVILFLLSVSCVSLFARSKPASVQKYSVEHFYYDVEETLGHQLKQYEVDICNTVYLYYYKKEGSWKSKWDTAVLRAADTCLDKRATTLAKTGDFGEKMLQSIIVTSEDIGRGFFNWINSGSEEYKKRHGN